MEEYFFSLKKKSCKSIEKFHHGLLKIEVSHLQQLFETYLKVRFFFHRFIEL